MSSRDTGHCGSSARVSLVACFQAERRIGFGAFLECTKPKRRRLCSFSEWCMMNFLDEALSVPRARGIRPVIVDSLAGESKGLTAAEQQDVLKGKSPQGFSVRRRSTSPRLSE